MILSIIQNGRKVIIGQIEKQIFWKKVDPKKHFCYKHKGYGIQADTWDKVKREIKGVVLIAKDKRWYISRQKFERNKINDNLGYGLQYFVPLEKFKQITP